MTLRRSITIILWLIAAVFIYLAWNAEGYDLPNQGKYQSLIRKQKNTQESEIESSRAENPRRKASENKRPWLANSLLEMENLVFAPFESTVLPNLGWPRYVWPDGTRHDELPWEIPLEAGCILSAPATWNIVDDGTTYKVHINYLYGVVRGIGIKGPAKAGALEGLDIPIHVYENAEDGTEVTVSVLTVSVTTGEHPKKEYGGCSAKTTIRNKTECECVNADPLIYATSSTINPGSSINMYVDSGGYACPPYSWTVSGLGYSLNKGTTDNDLEVVTLSSASGSCGTNYAAVASVTVTDNCGRPYNARFRNTGGKWVQVGYSYIRCQQNCSVGCWNAGCPGGSCAGVTYADDAVYKSTGGIRKWRLLGSTFICGYTNMGPAGWIWCNGSVPATGDVLPPFCNPPSACNAGTGPCADVCYCEPDTAVFCDWECSGTNCSW